MALGGAARRNIKRRGLRMTKSYEELLADMTGIIAKIYEKGFDKGYEQGKFDQRMETAFEDVKRVVNEETRQQKRDRIIEKAKKDIEELKDGGMYDRHTYACTAEYIVNKDKRTVVAILRGFRTGKVRARGIAKCAPNDCFNVHIGKAIALRRALGLEVPDEYLNAPHPTRVRKGDIVESTIHGKDHVFKVEVGSGEKPIAGKPHADAIYVKRAKIIDDSREEATK